jgi:hypothetical protein
MRGPLTQPLLIASRNATSPLMPELGSAKADVNGASIVYSF